MVPIQESFAVPLPPAKLQPSSKPITGGSSTSVATAVPVHMEDAGLVTIVGMRDAILVSAGTGAAAQAVHGWLELDAGSCGHSRSGARVCVQSRGGCNCAQEDAGVAIIMGMRDAILMRVGAVLLLRQPRTVVQSGVVSGCSPASRLG